MQNTAYRTTYRKICTYAGNDILEKLTESEQRELDRKRRNRKKKAERKETRDAVIMATIMILVLLGMVVAWILGIG